MTVDQDSQGSFLILYSDSEGTDYTSSEEVDSESSVDIVQQLREATKQFSDKIEQLGGFDRVIRLINEIILERIEAAQTLEELEECEDVDDDEIFTKAIAERRAEIVSSSNGPVHAGQYDPCRKGVNSFNSQIVSNSNPDKLDDSSLDEEISETISDPSCYSVVEKTNDEMVART